MGESVSFANGQEPSGGFLTRPSGEGPFPAIILTTAIAGVNDYVERVAGRFADEGFVCIALDYYVREGSPPDLSSMDKILAAVAALPDERTVGDMKAALGYLQSQDFVKDDSIGSVGFCIGGTYALLAGSQVPGLKVTVPFYGMLKYTETTKNKPVSPMDTVDDIACPLLGHFGEADHLVPAEHAVELQERLKGKPAEVYTYPGAGHAFHEDFRPEIYRPVAAQTAWHRTLTYLRWYLSEAIN